MRIHRAALALALLTSATAVRAQFESAPAEETPQSIVEQKSRIVGVVADELRAEMFGKLAASTPETGADVGALFDLFVRFPDEGPRRAVLSSLARLSPSAAQLEPLFLTYLRQPDPEAQFFGMNGAFRLRSRAALPLIRSIAQRKFTASAAADTAVLAERNKWWTQYEALAVLSQWEGEQALPILDKRIEESPEAARLLGQYFWTASMPRLAAWARSANPADQARARAFSSAPISPEDARASRKDMLALLADPKVRLETRHALALKIGAVSEENEIAELIAGHDAASPKDKVLWAAAVFASRKQAAVPLIARYAREAKDEELREGARGQLVDMLGAEAAAALLKDGKTQAK